MNQSRMNRLREEGGRISVTLPPRLARAAIAEMERRGPDRPAPGSAGGRCAQVTHLTTSELAAIVPLSVTFGGLQPDRRKIAD